MIEAVNSVVSNASLLRQSVQQASGAANVETVNQLPLAPYLDRVSVDTNFDTAVFEIRDNDTGDVLSQYPTESTLEARQRAESVRQRADILQQQRSALSREAPQAPAATDTQEAAPVQTTVTVAQAAEAAPQQSRGAGQAQVAIAALSTGAQASQSPSSGSEVSVTA